ncbi:hypothetical protein PSPO01_01208 [Paraphaeosphaeria sporulosa]
MTMPGREQRPPALSFDLGRELYPKSSLAAVGLSQSCAPLHSLPRLSQLYNAARSQHVGSRAFARHRVLSPFGKGTLVSPHSRIKAPKQLGDILPEQNQDACPKAPQICSPDQSTQKDSKLGITKKPSAVYICRRYLAKAYAASPVTAMRSDEYMDIGSAMCASRSRREHYRGNRDRKLSK